MASPSEVDRAIREVERKMIENADHFIVSMFRGRGVYDRTVAPSLIVARDVKRELDAANRAEGLYQKALIYAITADGRQIHVE